MEKELTYGATSRINHWVIAIAMMGMLGFGLYLEFGGLAREAKGPLIGIHKAIGVLILIFGLWRVTWRLLKGFPAPASNMPAWQDMASKFAHWMLLAGVVVMPVSGLVGSLFGGRAVSVFGLFTLPAQAKIEWLQSFSGGVHGLFGKALAVIVVIHFAAALKHHFIDKDATLSRMLRSTSKGDRATKG
ncbi:cytochrome b [Hydrogenophaga sp. PAMC20947]|uniref:cytochrome b n=1 Tax=Hydrogenophaga sp. PAMC20947 TaxID=2565558 RepID=UPI00109E0D44|nr:cytochrome b [Hydrogenophaga sp. PAMC20947]QCB47052.1 cytochrome b [Hydrogenophaga sp. PAMC20947]